MTTTDLAGEPDVAAPRSESSAGRRVLACSSCGTLQLAQSPSRPTAALDCRVCGAPLERSAGRSLDAALACSAATLVLLVPGNLLPFLITSVAGVSRESRLFTGAHAMWTDGQPLVAVATGLFVVVLPFVRFGLLTLALGALRLGLRPPWVGPALRVAARLQIWAMADVLLLALAVAYFRLADTVPTRIEPGAMCMIAAGVGSLLTRATLDKTAVWNLLAPDRAAPPELPAASCPACVLVRAAKDEDRPCPRCRAALRPRMTDGLRRAAALTLAGAILYVPANIYEMATLPIQLKPTAYTVLEGVFDLVQAKLLGLALLVFTASFVIPLLKLAVMTVCIASVLRRSSAHLRTKTTLYRLVVEIGRWSMVDPLVIACFVPVTKYNAILYGRADPAASFFTAVVILTIVAADQFDPRLMWDAARRPA